MPATVALSGRHSMARFDRNAAGPAVLSGLPYSESAFSQITPSKLRFDPENNPEVAAYVVSAGVSKGPPLGQSRCLWFEFEEQAVSGFDRAFE